MAHTKYEKELRVARDLAEKAGEIIMNYYFSDFGRYEKEDGTPVTDADLEANELILCGLKENFPSDDIVSEEHENIEGVRDKSSRGWYIDPIDGTKGFIKRTDQFAVHIGLANELQVPVLGVIHKPTTKETYYAIKGQGAYRRHPDGGTTRLEINKEGEDIESIVTNSSFFRTPIGREISLRPEIETVVISGGQGLRMLKVAEGSADAYLKGEVGKCSTWDICAPHIILEEAGAHLRYVDGGEVTYFGQRGLGKAFVIGKNKETYERAREMLRESISYPVP
jgi:3'(2'), 5'-bisphosphate nucleotidase